MENLQRVTFLLWVEDASKRDSIGFKNFFQHNPYTESMMSEKTEAVFLLNAYVCQPRMTPLNGMNRIKRSVDRRSCGLVYFHPYVLYQSQRWSTIVFFIINTAIFIGRNTTCEFVMLEKKFYNRGKGNKCF